MQVLISGVLGHMGQVLLDIVNQGFQGSQFFAGVDITSNTDKIHKDFSKVPAGCDVVVDFSHHSNTKALTEFAVNRKLPLVIATTGQTEEELETINKASETIPVFLSSNYSMGVAVLISTAKKVASIMKDAEIEIVETHHDRKIDAPSGTALSIAHAIEQVRPDSKIVCGRSGMSKRSSNEIGISSIRIGNVVGIHEVIVGTQTESITLKHEAYTRAVFAEGALTAADFLIGKAPGLYSMSDMTEV